MPNGLPLVSLLVLIVMGSAFYLLWRWRQLTLQRQDAEQRAAVAFLEMNRLTKELKDRGKAEAAAKEAAAALPPGERLQQMYPGAKPGGAGDSGPPRTPSGG